MRYCHARKNYGFADINLVDQRCQPAVMVDEKMPYAELFLRLPGIVLKTNRVHEIQPGAGAGFVHESDFL